MSSLVLSTTFDIQVASSQAV